MRNMENLEEMFTSARAAKMNTDNHIREREELYQKKAIDFLKVYNFNEVVANLYQERAQVYQERAQGEFQIFSNTPEIRAIFEKIRVKIKENLQKEQ